MSITIQHHEDVRFSAHFGRHQVSIDLPESHGGQDSGMTPPHLFVAALGACAGVSDCLLHNTLANPPQFDVQVTARDPALPTHMAAAAGCETGACCRPQA